MGQNIAENNRRIAKNTLYMYFRMIISLCVSLITARVVLKVLGVNDYGLNNVVAGFVSMLGYFNSLLYSATSRFLTVELGRNEKDQLKKTFSACLTIHLIIAIITILLGETIGLWFLNNKLVIEPGRLFAANVVFQLALFSLALSIMQAPYGASIISHEKMSIYAYMSIFDVVMKLLVVFLLLYCSGDKLILYSVFYFIVNIINIVFYRIYCIRSFEECSLVFGFDKKLYKDIFNYVGWNSLSGLAFMMNGQGVNVLLNLFFGTVVNAARGISGSVCGYLTKFVSNFQVAVNPQVMKYYAQNDIWQMNHLTKNNSKYSLYLVILMSLPVIFETKYILHLWLGVVPEYTVFFIRVSIIILMIQAIDYPIGNAIHAYGKMKLPNLTTSLIYMLALPFSYVFMKLGADPTIAYISLSLVYPCALVCDLWILHKYSGFNRMDFLVDVIFRGLFIICLSVIIPYLIYVLMDSSIYRLLFIIITSIISSAFFIFYIGMNKIMRKKVVGKCQKFIFKLIRK